MSTIVTRIPRSSREGFFSLVPALCVLALAAVLFALPQYGEAAEKRGRSARLVLESYSSGSGAAEHAGEASAPEPEGESPAPEPAREAVANELEEQVTAPEPEGDAQEPVPAQDSALAGEAPETSPPGSPSPEQASQKAAEAPKPAITTRLFGTVEFRSPIKNLPKWERVRGSEDKKPSFTAKGLDTANANIAQRWNAVKENVKNASLLEKTRAVNTFFNQWPYKTDLDNWGVEDYWATPREFVRKSGDCEDYSIAKYYALRDLGVPAHLLRVAAIKDTIRNLGHAVLIVYMDNDAYVLDNLTNLVLSHKKLSHYAPQYSVNEEYLWRHVKPMAAPAKRK